MNAEPPPTPNLRTVAGALLLSAGTLLGGAAYLQRSVEPPPGFEVIAYVAVAMALLSPGVAALVREGGAQEGRRTPGRQLAFFAILEGAVALCAVALLLTESSWPLLAGLVPLASMILNLVKSPDS